MAFFELRTYTIKQGCRDPWVRLMESVVIPFQVEKGMTVIASFISLDEEDTYIWIRRFESEDQRKALYDAVYGSETWKTDIRTAMGDMLIREEIKVQRLEATPDSPIQ